jgi:hypothetical protein
VIPGLGFQNPAAMPRRVLLDLVRKGRPRIHERHLPDQHVPELRQLVDAGLSKNVSDRCDPWIVGELEKLVGRGNVDTSALLDEATDEFPVRTFFCTNVHRPKLEHLEGFAHLADPKLPEQNRSWRSQPHHGGDHEQQGREPN